MGVLCLLLDRKRLNSHLLTEIYLTLHGTDSHFGREGSFPFRNRLPRSNSANCRRPPFPA